MQALPKISILEFGTLVYYINGINHNELKTTMRKNNEIKAAIETGVTVIMCFVLAWFMGNY
jgi:hypothetical protein